MNKKSFFIDINRKKISARIIGNTNSDFIYILNHGLLSAKESFKLLEKWGGQKYLFFSFDARGNEGSKLKASRYACVYEHDLYQIVKWVKMKFPKKKIILLGSSWGASVVVRFMNRKKYAKLIYKGITWSIPHKLISSDEAISEIEKKENNQKHKKYRTTSVFGMAWRFLVTILFNIKTKIAIKIDEEGITKNVVIKRISKFRKPVIAQTKYLWASFKAIFSSFRAIKKINKKGGPNLLYIQSKLDSYGKEKTFAKLNRISGKNVKYLLVNEFGHAFQWEMKNDLNIRIFKMMENWINTNEVIFKKPTEFQTISNRKPTFSFIVTSYNVEKYIKKSVDSIINNQKDNDYEIIIIDDNSKDRTFKIINKNYSHYKNIKIIKNSENRGISQVRNIGISNMKGEWCVFVDGDDYISQNFVENAKQHLDKNFNFYIYSIFKDKQAKKMDKKMQRDKVDDSIVSRIIHHSLFKKYKFPEKYRYGVEDWDFYVKQWNSMVIKNLSKDKSLYYYYNFNPNSLSKAPKIYHSRVAHAIEVFSDKRYRKIALNNKIYGHYYYHLYCMAKIWFPDLLEKVKSIKYRTKAPLKIKVYYWLIMIASPLFKKIIYTQREPIYDE